MQINSVSNLKQYYPEMNNLPGKSDDSKQYFAGLKNKYSDVSMNMSNAYLFNNNSTTTLNISPEYLQKAANQPEVGKNIERLAGLARSFPQYLGTHNTMPDGTKVTGVSFVVDENGGVSCNCTYESKEQDDSPSFLDKILKRRKEKREEPQKQEEMEQESEQKIISRKELNLEFTEYFTGETKYYM